jgi:succinate dehydrogenase/fumarate reductase cytochrome b subunit
MTTNWQCRIRRLHRYLGVLLGIQFLFWTIGGLYFSWSNMDEIHGDFQKKAPLVSSRFSVCMAVYCLLWIVHHLLGIYLVFCEFEKAKEIRDCCLSHSFASHFKPSNCDSSQRSNSNNSVGAS